MAMFEKSRPGKFVLHGLAAAMVASAAAGLMADQLPPGASNAKAAAGSSWVQPRTAWGDPDLQGIWTTDDEVRVPVERPKELGTRAVLTEEEMASHHSDEEL